MGLGIFYIEMLLELLVVLGGFFYGVQLWVNLLVWIKMMVSCY